MKILYSLTYRYDLDPGFQILFGRIRSKMDRIRNPVVVGANQEYPASSCATKLISSTNYRTLLRIVYISLLHIPFQYLHKSS